MDLHANSHGLDSSGPHDVRGLHELRGTQREPASAAANGGQILLTPREGIGRYLTLQIYILFSYLRQWTQLDMLSGRKELL